MANITYTDKDKTATDGIANKWRDVDANEVKTAVNSKADTSSVSNVDNTSDANKPVSTAQAVAIAVVQSDINTHEALTNNPHSVTKSQVGLANADNTSDANKPVSSAQQTALDLKQTLINAAVALVDGASMALTAIKHTLASSSATRTFTISYTGDDITLEVTLSAASSTYTFPAGSLCVSEGVASGDNTLPLAGSSGDKYIIAIKKIGSAYYVACKNFGQ